MADVEAHVPNIPESSSDRDHLLRLPAGLAAGPTPEESLWELTRKLFNLCLKGPLTVCGTSTSQRADAYRVGITTGNILSPGGPLADSHNSPEAGSIVKARAVPSPVSGGARGVGGAEGTAEPPPAPPPTSSSSQGGGEARQFQRKKRSNRNVGMP